MKSCLKSATYLILGGNTKMNELTKGLKDTVYLLRKRERVYQWTILFMLIFFTIFFIISHNNYMKMVECNDDLNNLIDEQRTRHEAVIQLWERSYAELEEAYCNKAMEYHQLKESSLISYTKEEIEMLARCVEAEAGNYDDHKNSQRYITQVILNRIHSDKFPDTIEEVIYQKTNNGKIPQFSVAYNGMMDREVDPDTLANVCSVLVCGTDLPEYVCYFYSDSVTENWVNTLNIHDTVEGTVFAYEDKEDY